MENNNEKDMKVPLDNKEVLPPSETILVSRRKYRLSIIANVVALLTTALTVLGLFVPVFQTWITQESILINKSAEYEFKVRRVVDSMQAIADLKVQRENAVNREKIFDLMSAMRKELPNSAQISLYYTHNSGGVPVTGSPLNVTVLYTENNIEPCLSRSYWQTKVVPQGYVRFNKRLRDQQFVYVSNIEYDVDLTSDPETMEDLRCNNVKSLMGIYLKETGYAVYYIIVSWEETDPYLNNLKSKFILKRYSAEILNLLQTKSLIIKK